MERDTRRSRSQWRGCYKFEDIICDGDGETSPKRTGGLKMGSTYYYYVSIFISNLKSAADRYKYELDDGTEVHDASMPYTTTCPYLPGQPLNLLSVPVEVQTPRLRSASLSSMAIGDRKTMNPADKFMTPRAPPAPPATSRLRTAPSQLLKKRSARSVSPGTPRSPWSPKSIFGLRSPSPPQESDRRGRSTSLASSNSSLPSLNSRLEERKSLTRSRNASPVARRIPSREPSPLRQFTSPEPLYNMASTLVIPDEIAEDDEDDENFASDATRLSILEKAILTPLAPPPTMSRFASSPPSEREKESDTEKPLPQLPEQLERDLTPQPLRLRDPTLSNLRLNPGANIPRSHFSISTVGSSPSESNFGFDSSESVDEDEDLSVDLESGDDSYSPVLGIGEKMNFTAYRLPETEYTSSHTLKGSSIDMLPPLLSTALLSPASRKTFGGNGMGMSRGSEMETREVHEENLSELEALMCDMGYLGGMIAGK